MDRKIMSLGCAIMLLTACGQGGNNGAHSDANKPTLDQTVNGLIKAHQLSGDPSTGRTLPSIDDPEAQLGMKLFFSKGLSGNMDTACVSCHHPVMGGGDLLSLSIGVEAETPDLLGTGRRHSITGTNYDGGPTVPRNAPTTFNIGLWDQALFLDGRIESQSKTAGMNGAAGDISTPDSGYNVSDPIAGNNLTQAQARFPVTSQQEMRGFSFEAAQANSNVRSHLVDRFNGNNTELVTNNWLAEFRIAFNQPEASAPELITEQNIFEAISEYERSQVFVNTPWKAYIDGDQSAISENAKRGAILFFSTSENGGANCASCHSGDFFTDEDFYVIAMPQIGRGKGNGSFGDDDFGRFNITADEDDRYAFRTPTLLNVEVTGPWGHAGAYTSLKETVRHHLNPQAAIDNYDFNQIDPSISAVNMKANTQLAMDKLIAMRVAGKTPVLEDIDLSERQLEQLVAFLNTLTDPCVKNRSCIGRWIPNAKNTNPDTLRLNAIDKNGDFL